MLRKTIVAAALAVAAAVGAKADYLYWQVNASDVPQGTAEWNMALVNVYQESNGALGEKNTIRGVMATEGSVGLTTTDISSYSGAGYYFSIELVNYSSANSTWTSVQEGWKWNYTELVSKGYVGTTALQSSELLKHGPLNGAATVPEPTSGVLLLIGGSLLALRRRRVAGASC